MAYKNEKAIGEAVRMNGIPRDEIVIVDKVHPKDIYIEGATIKAVEQSLRTMKVKTRTGEEEPWAGPQRESLGP